MNDQAWVDELNRKINEERNKPVPAPVVTEVKKEVGKNEDVYKRQVCRIFGKENTHTVVS